MRARMPFCVAGCRHVTRPCDTPIHEHICAFPGTWPSGCNEELTGDAVEVADWSSAHADPTVPPCLRIRRPARAALLPSGVPARAGPIPRAGAHGVPQDVEGIVKARAPASAARVGGRPWLQPARAAVEVEVSAVGPAAQPHTDDDADDADQGRQVSAGDLDDRDCRAPT